MKITISPDAVCRVPVERLKPGDTFRYHNSPNLYMVVIPGSSVVMPSKRGQVAVMTVGDGVVYFTFASDLVIPVEAECVVQG